MKITRIRVYRTELPYVGGTYVWGAGNAISTARASVVVIDTDAGLRGCGEFTPCGENYMVAHSEGVEAAARLIAPALLGQDPRQVARIERLMDDVIQGHGYAKAPFDAACWDILGQAAGQPVWMLLGGKLTPAAPMYRVAPQKPVDETIAEMETYRAQGYRQFQIKVGGDWSEDIDRIRAGVALLRRGEKAMADANQGWRVDNAIRVARATRHRPLDRLNTFKPFRAAALRQKAQAALLSIAIQTPCNAPTHRCAFGLMLPWQAVPCRYDGRPWKSAFASSPPGCRGC